MKVAGLVLASVAACGGARRPPAAPPAPAPVLPDPCRLHPTPRPDGLVELRRASVTPWPCNDWQINDELQWLEASDHELIGPAGTWDQHGHGPLAERDDPDGTHVVVVASSTTDLRCTGPGEPPGTEVDVDLPDQDTPGWIPIVATDRPIRLAFRYQTGGCTYERAGDHLVVHLPGSSSGPVVHRTAVAGEPRPDGDYVRVDGDLVVLSVPYDPDGPCIGAGPPPGQSYTEGGVARGFGPSPIEIEVPATGARVIVRRTYPAPVQCA